MLSFTLHHERKIHGCISFTAACEKVITNKYKGSLPSPARGSSFHLWQQTINKLLWCTLDGQPFA